MPDEIRYFTCPHCHKEIPHRKLFCPSCGANIQSKKLSKKKRFVRLGLYGIGILFLALIVYLLAPRLFFKIVSICSLLLCALSIITMILTFRKEKRVSVLTLTFSILVSMITLLLYSSLLAVPVSQTIFSLLIGCGLLAGGAWSMTTKLSMNNGQVKKRGNIYYLLIWGGIFILNQLITIFTGRPPKVAILLLILSTGLVVGSNGLILARSFHLKIKEKT